MIFRKTSNPDVSIISPELRGDERGYFTRIFAKEEFANFDIDFNIVHMNRSLTTTKGMIRGLHYQSEPMAEDKLVQCLKGSIFDVAIDIRVNSPTFGQWVGATLSEENLEMLLIPKGFAHGFQALDNDVIVQYSVTEYYSPEHEGGFRWDDPFFNIKWPITDVTTSEKDKSWAFHKTSK